VSAPLSEQQLAEIRGLDVLGLVGERNAGPISSYFAVLLAEVDRLRAQVDEMVHAAMGDRKVRLFDEVGEVQNARTIADVQLARANTLDRLCREKRARVAELEAERHSTNEALSDTAEALREKTQQLADAEQLRLTPLERLTLRFALELADDAIANDPTDITDADRAAMDKLRALSAGPVVAYRNPWRPGVLLCVEHGEGWEGMKPLSVEDLPNGGTCTAGDPADPDDVCGRDVLATEAGESA
jgi:hypothetical protein